jgi:hypothetical protein
MNEVIESRVLGALRWIDAVTQAPITRPLTVTGAGLRFTRNLSGLTVITHANGLEAYTRTFDLASLPGAEVVPNGSLSRTAEVEDPSGTYLPRRFTVDLPRDPSPDLLPPDGRRPAGSLFTPIDIALLPAPAARLPAGCAEVRVLIRTPAGVGIRNALARVIATSGGALLGCGLADDRGETLVAVPGLKHFAPGATEEEVVSVVTEARLEIILPPAGATIVDWTVLRAAAVAPGHTDPQLLQLTPGARISRQFPFAAA